MSDATSQTSYFEQVFYSSDPRRFAPIAIGLGFLIVVIFCAAVSVFARDDGGAMDFLISEGAKSRQAAYRAPVAAAPVQQAQGGFLSLFARPQRDAAAEQAQHARRAAHSAQRAAARTFDVEAHALGKRSVCVRLCDGYFFPIGPITEKADIAGHEALCSGLCPGAPARLYIEPSGSDKIEDAISTKDGQPYSALPVAFRHAGTADNACTCRRPGQTHARLVSTLKDFTLRRGDSVMTKDGFKVFRGSTTYPYRPQDFTALANEQNLTKTQRGELKRLERAAAYNKARDDAAQTSDSIEAAASPRLLRTLRPDHVQLVGEPKVYLR